MEGDKTDKLSMLVSSAEWHIVQYLKEHSSCIRKELNPYVIEAISTKTNSQGKIVHKPQLIHDLAFLIAIKELEVEGLLKIDRDTVPFPMTDFVTRFSLVKP